MKHLSIITAICSAMFFFAALPAVAQDEEEEEVVTNFKNMNYKLVYIAQDKSMDQQSLETNMRDAFNHAIAEGPAIFYLSCGKDPIIVKFNFSDDYREKDVIREEFEEKILLPLQEQLSHSVVASFDKEQLLELIQQNNYIDSDGMLIYGNTDIEFYVGQDFWDERNNEALIASLFFELNIAPLKRANETFNFNVLCPRRVNFRDDTAPFGDLNPDGINQIVSPQRIL